MSDTSQQVGGGDVRPGVRLKLSRKRTRPWSVAGAVTVMAVALSVPTIGTGVLGSAPVRAEFLP